MEPSFQAHPKNPDNDHSADRAALGRVAKSDIRGSIAEFWGCSYVQAAKGLDLMLDAVMDSTIASGHLLVTGIGVWSIRQRSCVVNMFEPDNKARIERREVIAFHPSRVLAEVIRQPLSEKSLHLAAVSPSGLPVPFTRVWGQTNSDLEILERFSKHGKATTTDLYELMACRGMLSVKAAQSFVAGMRAVMREALLRDRSVLLSGFGSFQLRESAERVGPRPGGGEPIVFPAHRRLKFVAGAEFRARLHRRED